MRFLGHLLIAGVMYATPVWLLDQMVLPKLNGLQVVYSQSEEMTVKVSEGVTE